MTRPSGGAQRALRAAADANAHVDRCPCASSLTASAPLAPELLAIDDQVRAIIQRRRDSVCADEDRRGPHPRPQRPAVRRLGDHRCCLRSNAVVCLHAHKLCTSRDEGRRVFLSDGQTLRRSDAQTARRPDAQTARRSVGHVQPVAAGKGHPAAGEGRVSGS